MRGPSVDESEEVAVLVAELFDEPYRVTINQPSIAAGSHVGLLMGLVFEGRTMLGILMLEDGTLTQINTAYFSIDFRYDVESDRWVDRNAQEDEQR